MVQLGFVLEWSKVTGYSLGKNGFVNKGHLFGPK